MGERKSQEAIALDCSLSLLSDENQEVWLLWTSRDITERKRAVEAINRAQHELLDHQRNLNDAQRLAHLGSWEWETEMGTVLWSEEQYRIFEYELGAIVSSYEVFIAVLHEDDRDRVEAAIQRTVREDAPYDLTCRIGGAGGADRFIHCRGTVIRGRDGRPLKMVGTTLDVTERVKAEEVLRMSEERFHLAVTGSSDGIWDWNVVTNKVHYSSRFKELLSHADHDVVPLFDSFTSWAHPDDRDRALNAVYDHLHGEVPLDVEVRLQKKSGGYGWFRIRGQAIWDEAGKPVRLAGSLSDIHKAKSVEADLAKAAVELERQNAQLLEVRDQALAATQAKSDFLAAMSHEIRTPMNAIIGMADLLTESVLTQDQQAYVRRLSRAASGLLDLINDILDLSKSESGYLELETISFDLSELVETTVGILAVRASER